MRATKRRRPRRRVIVAPQAGRNLAAVAAAANYVGSPEHKDTPSFAGNPPRPRPDATLCDRSLADRRDLLDGWLREAITRGAVGGRWEGEFPRYVWALRDGRCYEARLVNRETGAYKGYELRRDEWPEGIEADHHE